MYIEATALLMYMYRSGFNLFSQGALLSLGVNQFCKTCFTFTGVGVHGRSVEGRDGVRILLPDHSWIRYCTIYTEESLFKFINIYDSQYLVGSICRLNRETIALWWHERTYVRIHTFIYTLYTTYAAIAF